MYESGIRCDDDCRLQRVVPYLLSMVSDPSASIRALALHYLGKTLLSVKAIPTSDACIFQDYILPSLSLLPNDPEEQVRVEYAAGLPRLTACASLFLAEGAEEGDSGKPDLTPLWKKVEKVMYELGSGGKSNTNSRRAILEKVDEMSDFLGRK